MRLTSNLISRNYLNNLNTNAKTLNWLNERVAANRSFLKGSDDPVAALKSLQIHRNLARIDLYQNNISDLQGILDESESAISSLNEIVGNAVAQVLQGKTGTLNEENRATIASALRSCQEQIISAANAKFGNAYVFGGESTKTAPFTFDASGNLLYNGQDINTGTFSDEYRYIDVGLGMTLDASGEVVPESAFNVAISGAQLLGHGVDADGLPNNLYEIIGDLAEMFENNDLTNLGAYDTKLQASADDIRLQYVSSGEKTKFIEFLSARYEADESNLIKKQESVEGIDTAKAIVEFSSQMLAYNACLQMGVKILQPSLLDYLR